MRVFVCSMLMLALLAAPMGLAQTGAKTVIFADRTSVYEGEAFNISVYYYDTTNSKWCPLPGAQVDVGEHVLITDADGRLTITLDRVGSYDMVASKSGFDTSEKFTVQVMPERNENELEKRLGNGSKPQMLEIGGANTPSAQKDSQKDSFQESASSAPAPGAVALLIAIAIVALGRRIV